MRHPFASRLSSTARVISWILVGLALAVLAVAIAAAAWALVS